MIDLENDKIPAANASDIVFENIVTQSAAMRQVINTMQKTALTDASVLIFGESGVGKELIARGIHNLSRRQKKAFIAVDCVALPSNLLESELFGFEPGSFTGATGRRHGLLEFAHEGTFFLDEICELDLGLQAKLLRVLQERQFRRIGGRQLINVDIRVISATNRDPELAVRDKILRQDLYFRLNVIPLHVPALRERREDIPLLANYFMKKFIGASQIEVKELAPETLQALQEYDWPGNVRELQNIIECVVSLCSRRTILPEDLPINKNAGQPAAPAAANCIRPQPEKSWRENLAAFKRHYFKTLLEQTNGDVPAAARLAKITPRALYRIAHSCRLL